MFWGKLASLTNCKLAYNFMMPGLSSSNQIYPAYPALYFLALPCPTLPCPALSYYPLLYPFSRLFIRHAKSDGQSGYVAWLTLMLDWLCCLPECAAWLSLLLDSLFAWLTLLLEPLCCLTHFAAWRIILLDWLCCLPDCVAWLSVLLDSLFAWLTLLLEPICCLTHFAAWRINMLDWLGLSHSL
jgi:hypothetical protein